VTASSDSTQFDIADRAIARAAEKIERAVADLLERTIRLDRVARDYVIEVLISELIERNPEALDWLNRQRREASMRLANAVEDWRDLRRQR
jgi:bacterioferritin (cytochrome b1)